MKKRLLNTNFKTIIIIILVFIVASCATNISNVNKEEKIIDNSFLISKYFEMGVPSPERVWSGHDLRQASDIFAKILSENPYSLPRYQSKKSGKLFERLISDENLSPLKDVTISLEIRGPATAEYLDGFNGLLNIYAKAYLSYHVDNIDYIELNGFLLKITAILVRNNLEFINSLEQSDPRYDRAVSGMNNLKEGLAKICFGAINKLEQKDVFGSSSLIVLINHMSQSLPEIVASLSPNNKKEVILKLKSMKDNPSLSEFSNYIEILLKRISEIDNS